MWSPSWSAIELMELRASLEREVECLRLSIRGVMVGNGFRDKLRMERGISGFVMRCEMAAMLVR